MAADSMAPRRAPPGCRCSRSPGARLPGWVRTWLRHVPVAVFTALLARAVLQPEGRLDLSPRNSYLIAAAVAATMAWRTRHVLATLLAGVTAILVVRALI